MAFPVLTAEKHTENSGKISVENFGETISFFGAFFGTFFSEQLFASKSEKFEQNPFCKRDPLNRWTPKEDHQDNTTTSDGQNRSATKSRKPTWNQRD